MHETFIFFIDENGEISPVPRQLYVELLRGNASAPQYAGSKVRVADLYVELKDGRPVEIDNETYSYLVFDDYGNADPWFREEEDVAGAEPAARSIPGRIDGAGAADGADDDWHIGRTIGNERSWFPTLRQREKLFALIFDPG